MFMCDTTYGVDNIKTLLKTRANSMNIFYHLGLHNILVFLNDNFGKIDQ